MSRVRNRMILTLGFLAASIFGGATLCGVCKKSPQETNRITLPRKKSSPPYISPPWTLDDHNNIPAPQSGRPPSEPNRPQPSVEGGRFSRLAEISEKRVIMLEEGKISRERVPQKDGSPPCLKVSVNGKEIGYVTPWVPKSVSDEIAEGNVPDTLTDTFPLPRSDVYYDITNSDGIPLGKTNDIYSDSNRQYLFHFIWNNGNEEFYLNKNNLLYRTDRWGNPINQRATWQVFTKLEEKGINKLYHRQIVLLSNPSIQLTLGAH